MTCINCSQCGYPHLDLGDFARKPHRKHFCGNCGCDSTWSPGHIVSTPLKPLYDQFAKNTQYKEPDRTLNLDLDKYSGCDYEIWASTPAILWTAERPQEKAQALDLSPSVRTQLGSCRWGAIALNGQVMGEPARFPSQCRKEAGQKFREKLLHPV